jgi:hypothetical protein
MADVKIYVEVHNFAVKDIFESKHKSRLIALMKKTAEKAIKDKLALGAPKDKGARATPSTAVSRRWLRTRRKRCCRPSARYRSRAAAASSR